MKYAKKTQAFILAGSILVGWLAYALHSGCQKGTVNQPVLRSESAGECLKEEALYDSLQAAVSAARYRFYADEKTGNAFYANNSAQQLSAYFMPDAARITVKHNANPDSLTSEAIKRAKTEAPLQSEQSQLRLRFIGAGSGDAIHRAQGQPAIIAADNRLTYTHQLSSNPDSASGLLSLSPKSAIRNPQSAIVEEWYVNKAEGLEHGFTLRKPVGERVEGERLKLELELDGDFLAQVVEEGKAIVFKSKDGGVQLSYAGLKVFDAEGRELVSRMSVNDTVLRFEVDDADAVYPVTIDPTFTQQQKLVPGITASDSFSSDVAISGDTAVVGARLDDIGANADQGSIFIFVRSGTTWSQQAKLTANDGAAGDNFGFSVAISLNTIVVAAPNDDIGANQNQGSAYVFVRSGTTWSQQAKLTGLNQAGNLFGYDVTIDGDYAAMSAKGATFFGIEGYVFIFHRVGATWTKEEEHPGEVQERTTDDDFGESIALSGNTLVIGAPSRTTTFPPLNPCTAPPPTCGYPPSCSNCSISCTFCCDKTTEDGAVHILVRSGTSWSVQQTIIGASSIDPCRRFLVGEHLGKSVAISGNTIVIGSPEASAIVPPPPQPRLALNVGKVSIWVRSGTTWTSQYNIVGNNENAFLGGGVAIDADTVVYSGGSGGNKVLVRSGTTWSVQQVLLVFGSEVAISGNTALSGSSSFVKVFVRSGTTWSEQTELTAQEGATADQFGYSVAIDGDTAVVGIPFKNAGTTSDRGSVFVFRRSSSTWQQQAELFASDGAAGHRFGEKVAIEGDTVVVGASQPFAGQGAVYVFTRSGTSWTQRTKIIAADGEQVDLFGQSVALSGNTLVVGSPLEESTGGNNNGSAYVFTGSGATWTQQAKLRAIEEANDDQFGYDVDIDGETIAVGARFVANGATTLQGAAYVFTRTATTWVQQARLLASDGATDDRFGESVSVRGDTLAVGSHLHNIGANSNQGAVYIFNRSGSAWAEAQILTANDGATDDTFGISVALQNDALLIGASGDDFASTTAQGSAYVFIRSGLTWTEAQKIFALDGATNDNYGNAVALDDRTFLIGAHFDDFGATIDQGSAYVFVASGATIWTGANSSDWSTGSNWDSTTAPNALDDVTLPASGVTNEAVISTDVNVRGLTVEAGRSLTINAGRTLTVNGNLTLRGTITGGGTLIFNGANFINNNSANVANVRFGVGVKQLSGTGLFFGNTVTVLSGSTLQLSSNHTMNRLVVNNGGTLNISATNTLSLLGSGVAFTNNGSVAATGTVSFDGTSPQSTSGSVTFGGLTVNNAAGVTLGADATVNNTLALTSGDLNTGAFTLMMLATAASTGTTDVVGNVKRTDFATANLSYGNPFNTIFFTSGTVPTDVTMNLVKQAPGDFTNATRRTYTITPNGGASFSATLQLHYQDTELNGNIEATLGLWRKGASWTNLGATTRNATDNWVELAGIGQFSPWVISGPADPVVANSISGTISYCIDQSKKVPNATVATSSGSPSATTTTDASGLYQLNNLGGGPYAVAPSKTGAVSGISAFDAALVGQYVAGITTPTACQMLAGDSSNNGGLSAFDAALIAQTVAGISNPGIAGAWKFVPASRSYPSLNGNIPNENYDAVLVGDVSGNWTPAGPERAIAAPAGGGNVAVTLPNWIAAPGSTNVMVPVIVDNTTGQGIIAYDFTFTFNTSVIQLANPAFETNGTLSNGWNITPNTSTPGQIRIVAFNTTPLSGSGILIFIKFNVVGAEGAMTPLTWTNFVFNEGTPTASVTNGSFTATAPSVVKLEKFAATGYDGGVYLEWKTGLEADNLGFNVYRERAGQRELVNSETVAGSALLTGQTRLETGRTYSWWDKEIADCGSPIADCRNVQYWLEDIDLNGARELHGPFSVNQLGGKPSSRSSADLLRQVGRSAAKSTPARFGFRPGRSNAQLLKQQELASQPALKLTIKEEGWYSVSRQELLSAGLDPDQDALNLQLYVEGQEVPMLVVGERGQSFDAIEFYATGQDTPATDAHTYWLVAGKTPGKRINIVKSGGEPGGAPSFSYAVEKRDRTIYFSALRNGEAENFFGSVVTSRVVDQNLDLRHIDTSAQAAELEVALQGVTAPTHSVSVAVNGVFVGRVIFNAMEHKAEKFSLYQSYLKEGDNTVTLQAEGGQMDVSLVDYIRLTYQHTYKAEANELKLVAGGHAGKGGNGADDTDTQTVGGFTNSLIRVIDVTDPSSAEEIAGSIEKAEDGYQVTVNVAGKGARTLLAFTTDRMKWPAKITANQPSSLRSRNNGADLLVLTRRDLIASLQPLVELRRMQGLSVLVIDVEDILDEFNYGEPSPQAVKEFISYVATNWKKKPRFVLMAGDGTFDPKGYLGIADGEVVATKLIDTQFVETASDEWFVDLNNDGIGELAIGRLPMRDSSEAAVMIGKILGYEQARPSEEVMLVSDTNDGFNFESASNDLRGLIPAGLRVNQINRGSLDADTAKKQLLEGLNRGQKLVNYMGHGNVDLWRGNLLTSEDARGLANGQRLSVFVMMTCLNGYFGDPVLRSLAEELMRSERGGAVAVWASDGMTFPGDQALINQQFYRLLFGEGGSKVQAMTLGEATQRAKAATAEPDVRRTWILFGDPTMRLK